MPARSEPTGSAVQVSSVGLPGNAAFDADDPRVAFGADGRGLAVYLGEPVDGEQEAFGQTVDASGAPVGAQHRLTHVGPDGASVDEARNPDVVYNRARTSSSLVSSNAIAFDEDVAVQRVGLDGTPIGASVPSRRPAVSARGATATTSGRASPTTRTATSTSSSGSTGATCRGTRSARSG